MLRYRSRPPLRISVTEYLASFWSQLADRLWLVVPCLVLGFVVELLTALEPVIGWRHRLANLWATTLYWGAEVLMGGALTVAVFGVMQQLPGQGVMPLQVTADSPAWVTVLFILIWLSVADFFYYWMHRWQHSAAWFWALHEVHHSDPHMNVTTTWRHHWLDKQMQVVLVSAPVAYLCRPSVEIVILGVLANMVSANFIHLNSRISFGRWNWVLANPHHHRIHHSAEPQHIDKNFAAFLPLWDVLFGTYYAPAKAERPRTGLASGPNPTSAWDLASWPLRRWGAMCLPRSRRQSAESRLVTKI